MNKENFSVAGITGRTHPDFTGAGRREALEGAQEAEKAKQIADELARFNAAAEAKKAAGAGVKH